MRAKISIVTPCYNEQENVKELYSQIKSVLAQIPEYDYEHIFIDNHSTDNTVTLIKGIAADDKNVKLIVNARNFGHIRSPVHGMLQASGNAVILLASDLQDPPAMILDFIKHWKNGYKVVMAVKNQSKESPIFFAIRKMFYNLIGLISEVKLVKNYTGAGLYDREVIETIRKIDDPYPYFRGLIPDLGYKSTQVYFTQPIRTRGFSKNNFYTLYDIAMLGITSYSRVPLRLATMFGFFLGTVSFILALAYLVLKLVLWDKFSLGVAPLLIGFFFMAAVQLFFIGIIGEYVGQILTQVQKRPLVVEEERVGL